MKNFTDKDKESTQSCHNVWHIVIYTTLDIALTSREILLEGKQMSYARSTIPMQYKMGRQALNVATYCLWMSWLSGRQRCSRGRIGKSTPNTCTSVILTNNCMFCCLFTAANLEGDYKFILAYYIYFANFYSICHAFLLHCSSNCFYISVEDWIFHDTDYRITRVFCEHQTFANFAQFATTKSAKP